jgi:hypothetical protein
MTAQILEEIPCKQNFPWLKNIHTQDDFGPYYNVIARIFQDLGGNEEFNHAKQSRPLMADAYFGGQWNFLFEFDEFQHFSTARRKTLEHYPSNLKLAFDVDSYKSLCRFHAPKADAYRTNIRPADFDFVGGRTSQRAYLDCFRDFLPLLHGLKPTLRVTEFEVSEVYANTERSRTILRDIIFRKLSMV